MKRETPAQRMKRVQVEIGELLGELAGLYCAGGDSLHDLREAMDRLPDYQILDTAARLRTVRNRLLNPGAPA